MSAQATTPSRTSLAITVITAAAIGAAAVALWLFPRAMPIVALHQSLSRDVARTRADSFFRAHDITLAAARTAVRFEGNDSLGTFVELAGGGHDSLNALVQGADVAPYVWSVRAFAPGNPREMRVHFAPDGRVVGFRRTLAEDDTRPDVGADSGRVIAERMIVSWLGERLERWRFVTASYETRKTSGRIDRRFTYERNDRTIAGAPIRLDVQVAGDTPSGLRPYVEIPESFRRRYGEMRSANDLLALIASLGALAIIIAGIAFLSRSARNRDIRWRPALIVGGVIGMLALAAGVNDMPGSWYTYDTATSPTTFLATNAMAAIGIGVVTTLLVVFTLAAAEAATRKAFPAHLDWWKLWHYRATRDVTYSVGGGYAAACLAFAYVAVFYLATRTLLGWWVPSELLDDPNQLSTPMPWVSGIAASLQAGVWEEALFRALPLSLVSLWVGNRSTRKWWMALGVVVTALIFGFAHSNYASWPPYSRGVEIFLDACFWAVLFLNFGLIVTVVAHFVYDLVLFGLFAATGSATEYRISAAIIAVALLAPALAVLWPRVRRMAFVSAPDAARFGAVLDVEDEVVVTAPSPGVVRTFPARTRQLALGAVVVAIIVAIGRPPLPTLGPPYTAQRAQVLRTADSVLTAHGASPSGWRRLATTATSDAESWPRFVDVHNLYPRAHQLAATYVPPAWWIVRYVHSDGATPQQRTEEWRIRVWPDGRPLDVRHIIADSAPRTTVAPAEVRRIAQAALERAGVGTTTLTEAEYKETARPSRTDVIVTYNDTSAHLPAGAVARAWVQVAGDDPLVARRTVELPETFLRAERNRQDTRSLIAGACAMLLVGGVITGAIIAIRKRVVQVDDGHLGRRDALLFVALLTVLALLDHLNGLPSTLYSYNTAEPWSRFVTTTLAGFVGPLVTSLVLLGVWLTLAALRRRVGIPLLASVGQPNAARDMLVAGVGLGAVAFAMVQLSALIPSNRVPHLPATPSTTLDQYLPWLAGVAGEPASSISAVAIVAIPLLTIAALSQRLSFRLLMTAIAVALLTGFISATSSSSQVDMVGIALAVTKVLVVAIAVYAWGFVSAWSWFVAVLVFQGFNALRGTAYAPVFEQKVAGALDVVVVYALVVLIVRHARKRAA